MRKLAKGCVIALAAIALLPCLLTLCLWLAPRPELLENIPFGSVILDKNGGILRLNLAADSKYRLKARLENMPQESLRALFHYEDKYFYSHLGVNPLSLLRAIPAFLGYGRKIGGSTITMQTARLRYGLRTGDITGKMRQIWLALLLERYYSKEEILEAYFNLAPFGGNIEGIEAAAHIYFNKPAALLTPGESYALAVIPQNPNARHPVFGKEFHEARLRLEKSLGCEDEAVQAARPIFVRNPNTLPFSAPHISLELSSVVAAEPVIHTGIEPDLQAMLERSLASFTARGMRYGVDNAAGIIVDCATMEVSALAGSANFYNSSISGQIDGTRARRSPGSTLKPFIYALAVEQGLIHPMSMLPDSPRSFGGYDPENFDKGFRGPLPAHEALKASRNLPAIGLAERLQAPGLYGFLKEANVELLNSAEYYGLALTLGGAEVSMRELAALYAMLGNYGVWQPLRMARENYIPQAKRLLSPEAAWITLKMLERPEARIRSRNSNILLRYKTGTSNGLRDAWTAGLAGKYVVVIWVGSFDNRSNPLFVGARTALPIFMEVCRGLGSLRQLRDTGGEITPGINISEADVCASTGDFDTSHCRQTEKSFFIPGVTNVKDSGIMRPILVDRASGLRACEAKAGETTEVWWEFWPTDMLRIFANAGINKPRPPDWLPQCQGRQNSAETALKITLPKKNVSYHRKLDAKQFHLPLQADSDAVNGTIHWYNGNAYIGSSRPGEVFLWQTAKAGRLDIVAVDNLGRSARRVCEIMTVP